MLARAEMSRRTFVASSISLRVTLRDAEVSLLEAPSSREQSVIYCRAALTHNASVLISGPRACPYIYIYIHARARRIFSDPHPLTFPPAVIPRARLPRDIKRVPRCITRSGVTPLYVDRARVTKTFARGTAEGRPIIVHAINHRH